MGLIRLHSRTLSCLLVLLLGLPLGSEALEISTTFGKEAGEDFSVLSLKNDIPFACAEVLDVHDKVLSIECKISRIPDRGFPGLENSFFRLTYKMIDGDFWLYIYPKYSQKLFAVPKDPKSGFSLDKYPQQNAHIWQIVGYKNKIPFLSQENQQRQGLDFPVMILGEQTPVIPELNTDNRPLQATKNKDFEMYSLVRKSMERQDYIGAITEINEALQQNPNSVFRRDLTYDRIIATSKLGLENQEALIKSATEWVKIFASDPDLPEVLYILAGAYALDNVPSEAEYYYKRIGDEYPESKFAPLAQMQLANLSKSYAPTRSRIYFQKAYTEARDVPSASEIALQWALFEVEENNLDNAKELVYKVFDNYPQFFLHPNAHTDEIIEAFVNVENYADAAKIAQYLAEHTKDGKIKEDYAFRLGEYYAQAQDFENAHRANQFYLQNFSEDNVERAKIVQRRDDEILFVVDGSDEDKLKHYAYLISKYPNGEESAKAKDLAAKILLQRGAYKEVLTLYAGEEQSAHYQSALDALLKEAIAQKECRATNTYLLQVIAYNLTPQEKLFAFDCANQAGLAAIAKNITQGMVESSTTPNERLEWLYRVADNLYKLGEYKNASLAARDAYHLAINQKSHYDIAFILFKILSALDSRDEAKRLFPFLKEHFPKDERILPVYATLLGYAIDEKDITTTEIYASTLLTLQETLKVDEFTPYAEFALVNALKESKNFTKALEILRKLESKKIEAQELQQLFYQSASIYHLQGQSQKALEYFEKCTKIEAQSEWHALCKQASELEKERTKAPKPSEQQAQNQESMSDSGMQTP